jgi:hypothetical protein
MAQSQWIGSKWLVQNDYEVFLTLVQNGSFFTKISNKKNRNSSSANSYMDGDIFFDTRCIFMKSINWLSFFFMDLRFTFVVGFCEWIHISYFIISHHMILFLNKYTFSITRCLTSFCVQWSTNGLWDTILLSIVNSFVDTLHNSVA